MTNEEGILRRGNGKSYDQTQLPDIPKSPKEDQYTVKVNDGRETLMRL